MAPNPRVTAAYRAMKSIGIQEVKVKPVLKKLLKLYEKNWELIEEENYRALADAVFEEEENQTKNDKNINEEEMEDEDGQLHDEPVRPLKRLRLRGQESPDSQPKTRGSPSSVASPLKRPKLEDDRSPESCSRQKPQNTAVSSQSTGNARTEIRPVSPRDGIVDKGKQPVSPPIPPRERGFISKRPLALTSKESEVESGILLLPKTKMPHTYALIKPKDEPVDDLPGYEVPIAVIPPEEPSTGRGSAMINDADGKQKGHQSLASGRRDKVRGKDIHTLPNGKEASCEDATIQGEGYSNVEIASSRLGEVKISLSYSSSLEGSDFRLPSREQLIKVMEDKCLRSYHISDPKFSLLNLLRDMCDCILELKTDSNDGSKEGSMQIIPSVNGLDESEENDTLSVRGNKVLDMLPLALNGSIDVQGSAALVSPQFPIINLSGLSGLHDAVRVAKKVRTEDVPVCNDKKGPEDRLSPNSGDLVVVPQHQLASVDLRSLHDANDLTKGEESVKIPWINKTTNDFPPSFYYIPGNLVFCNAYVNMSLVHIGDEDCCSACLGNCLLSSTPCSCANKAGGGFAYTLEGLVKDELLEECIAISHNRQQYNFYCIDCPLERSRNDDCLEPCKGHLKRKFIKECWSKCGCGKQCGNRIVQRGITCNLQVFLTIEGKGWGLRTLEDLPKGAFVCEFVGEILTIEELWKRNMQCTQNGKHTYPILLDSGWDLGNVKDKEALSLDAASYGNVARFINHRCMDANLVGIPVEVETPDHRYYHDYGIDFDDHEHPIQPFHCRCGSKYCRNMKRPNRSTRSASTAR